MSIPGAFWILGMALVVSAALGYTWVAVALYVLCGLTWFGYEMAVPRGMVPVNANVFLVVAIWPVRLAVAIAGRQRRLRSPGRFVATSSNGESMQFGSADDVGAWAGAKALEDGKPVYVTDLATLGRCTMNKGKLSPILIRVEPDGTSSQVPSAW